MNTYIDFLSHHEEGEIVAKIDIPANRLEKVKRWDPSKALAQLSAGKKLGSEWMCLNPGYTAPEWYSNVREVLL